MRNYWTIRNEGSVGSGICAGTAHHFIIAKVSCAIQLSDTTGGKVVIKVSLDATITVKMFREIDFLSLSAQSLARHHFLVDCAKTEHAFYINDFWHWHRLLKCVVVNSVDYASASVCINK